MKRRTTYRAPVCVSRTLIVLALLTVASLSYAVGVLIVMLMAGLVFE
jgi:hypothetical protein